MQPARGDTRRYLVLALCSTQSARVALFPFIKTQKKRPQALFVEKSGT
jgi:hypothetical protein